MTKETERKVDYLVVVVSEFARATSVSQKEAFTRLASCGGIDALDENYEIEHTLSIESTIDALKALCGRAERATA